MRLMPFGRIFALSLVAALLAASGTVGAFAQSKKPAEPTKEWLFKNQRGVFYYRYIYPKMGMNKAFAVSANGVAWGVSPGKPTMAYAIAQALAICEHVRPKNEGRCQILDRNGQCVHSNKRLCAVYSGR